MAARRPLVLVNGEAREKADADTIVGLVIGTDVAAAGGSSKSAATRTYARSAFR